MNHACAERHRQVRDWASGPAGQSGQAALMMLAVIAAVLVGAVVLFAFGNALGAKGRYQRAADLAAISAARVMRDLYPRLFEPPFIEPDVPNPRHLEDAEYRERAVAAAIRGAERNGVRLHGSQVSFGGTGFAPTRVTVNVLGEAHVQLGGDARALGGTPARSGGDSRVRSASRRGDSGRLPIRARATAELLPDAGAGLPGHASGGGYSGPLAYRQGEPMPHLLSALSSHFAASYRSTLNLRRSAAVKSRVLRRVARDMSCFHPPQT